MTKKELMAMMATLNDNDELVFIGYDYNDNDYNYTARTYKVTEITTHNGYNNILREETLAKYNKRIKGIKEQMAIYENLIAKHSEPTKKNIKENTERYAILANLQRDILNLEKMKMEVQ